MSFFLLDADVANEIRVSDFAAVWDIMFANWEHGSSYLDYFVCWAFFANSIGEETYKSICVSSFPEVGTRSL